MFGLTVQKKHSSTSKNMPIIKALTICGCFFNGGIMKKSLKSLIALLVLNLVLVCGVFAEGYHVCVASYQKLSNATEMVQKLGKQSISAVISESKVKTQTVYRVLLAKEFKKIDDARKYRDEVQKYSFVKDLGLKGLWVCKSEKIISTKPVAKPAPAPAPKPVPAPKPAPAPKPEPKPVEKIPEPIPEPPVKNIAPEPVLIVPEEPKTLDVNEKAVLSEKTPYSVLVRSYKFNQFAENDSNRLKELGFDPYLLNTFDEKSFFAFNIHVGAFEKREDAEALRNQFTDAGIADTEISDYNEIKPKIEKYDEIISNEKVTFDEGRTELPTVIPASIEKLVKHFPANKDFQIHEISILNYEGYKALSDKPEGLEDILTVIGNEESMHSALLATYRDELYKKEVTVFLANSEQFVFPESSANSAETMQFGLEDGVFVCELYESDAGLTVCGNNLTEKLFVSIKSKDFSKEEFLTFLNDSFNENSLALYPQLRRSLFVLPDLNPSFERDFISFTFKKVGEDYAVDRDNVDWALPIVGHALARTFLTEKNSLFCLGFYDLDYDFNAKNVHKHFTDAKNTVEVSEINQPIEINGIEGWYLENPSQKEISFSTKSYVIALDAEPKSVLTKDDLIEISKEVKIWGTKAETEDKTGPKTEPAEREMTDAK